MKNSTLHRSNLSNERMALLKELKTQKNLSSDSTPGVYKRPGRQKELDILWQSFKLNQKDEKSPGLYLLTGFILGALSMFMMTAVLSISGNEEDVISDTASAPKIEHKLMKKHSKSKISIVPADKPAPKASSSEVYTVQNGDTLEGIIIRFYGKYDTSKIDVIKKANNLTSPDRLSIGQKLVIPLG